MSITLEQKQANEQHARQIAALNARVRELSGFQSQAATAAEAVAKLQGQLADASARASQAGSALRVANAQARDAANTAAAELAAQADKVAKADGLARQVATLEQQLAASKAAYGDADQRASAAEAAAKRAGSAEVDAKLAVAQRFAEALKALEQSF